MPCQSQVLDSMDNDEVRIAIGLRLGAHFCRPLCHRCGAQVDEQATHGLSCMRSAGRQSRHTAFKDIINRSLAPAQIPSTLEPTSLCRSDGKQPHGVTIAPWKTGRTLFWDATCTDTFAASNLSLSTSKPRDQTQLQDQPNRGKMTSTRSLPRPMHNFIPIVIETSGAFGCEALEFFTECGRRIRALMQEAKSWAYLIQQVSVALQHGNTASVLGITGPFLTLFN